MAQSAQSTSSGHVRPISSMAAAEVAVRSRLGGPIRDLGFLDRALLLAELAMASYLHERQARLVVERAGFRRTEYFDRDGSQAYLFENDTDCVIACRGTEPNDWNDIKADANAVTAVAETIGRVHRGFKREVDDLWPMLEKALVANTRTLWFTGHSLGGAMATICAGRCLLSHIPSVPEELQTFGSPRVGNKRYINYCRLAYYRWVNNNDIVTRVPPTWLGYRHTGEEIYLDARGAVQDVRGWHRTKDRWRGFISGLSRGNVDHFADHSIDRYIEYIHRALNRGGG